MKQYQYQFFSKSLKYPRFSSLRFPKLSKLDWLMIKFFAALLLLLGGMCYIHLLDQDLRSSFELSHIEALNKKLKSQEVSKGFIKEEDK
ncbi:MAG: hypothetical protein BGO76_01595 [Caedibacter sp. 38-128]|nr:hypothetical protein [Holosporales bacterium]OJX04506.1 MAG: hypothetical protein BGO76_01595 [Caedibacter sp. 38-128]